jgi:hypothetical protein
VEKRTSDRGLIQLIVIYLISFGPLLHSDELGGVVWLIIMTKVCIIGALQCSSSMALMSLGSMKVG